MPDTARVRSRLGQEKKGPPEAAPQKLLPPALEPRPESVDPCDDAEMRLGVYEADRQVDQRYRCTKEAFFRLRVVKKWEHGLTRIRRCDCRPRQAGACPRVH